MAHFLFLQSLGSDLQIPHTGGEALLAAAVFALSFSCCFSILDAMERWRTSRRALRSHEIFLRLSQ